MNKLESLRDLVDSEIRKLSNGESTVGKLNAIHGGLSAIVGAINTEIMYAKHRGEMPKISYLDGTE